MHSMLRVQPKTEKPMKYYIDGVNASKEHWHNVYNSFATKECMHTVDKNGKFYHYTKVR